MSGVHKYPTISFRISPREREEIEAKILASGVFLMTVRLSKKVFGEYPLKYIPKMSDKNFEQKVLTST